MQPSLPLLSFSSLFYERACWYGNMNLNSDWKSGKISDTQFTVKVVGLLFKTNFMFRKFQIYTLDHAKMYLNHSQNIWMKIWCHQEVQIVAPVENHNVVNWKNCSFLFVKKITKRFCISGIQVPRHLNMESFKYLVWTKKVRNYASLFYVNEA